MPNNNPPISTDAKSWHILHRSRSWKRPTPSGDGWSQAFPVVQDLAKCAAKKGACPYIGYARTPCKRPLATGDILTAYFKIETTGNPVFNYKMEPSNTGDSPAALRFFIQRKGDDWVSANGRFWCQTAFTLAPTGPVSLTARLEPGLWTNVYGQRDDAGFAKTLAKIGNVGLAFGGGSFYSHGVNVSCGTATLVLLGFSVVGQ